MFQIGDEVKIKDNLMVKPYYMDHRSSFFHPGDGSISW